MESLKQVVQDFQQVFHNHFGAFEWHPLRLTIPEKHLVATPFTKETEKDRAVKNLMAKYPSFDPVFMKV